MGSRHVRGFAALERTGLSNVRLVAVCDVREDNAARVADQVLRELGHRPTVHRSIESAVADPAVAAFDVVTEVSSHLPVALPALRAGKHVMSEKPLGLTVRACRALIEAAEAGGAVLATAENYRRDPPSRMVRAVVEDGLLGHLHLMIQASVGGDDKIVITPWRHLKEKGAIGLDMGVHYTDLIRFYLGEIESCYGFGLIAEPVRHRRAAPEMDLAAYRERLAHMPESVTATGEDSIIGLYRMRSGVLVQLSYLPSGPGPRFERRSIHGRAGSLEIFKDRSGRPPVLRRGDSELTGDELAAATPSFALDEVTRRLFGHHGPGYSLAFPEADAAALGVELWDFADAVSSSRRPEVDGRGGLIAVAAVLGVYESMLAGRPVTMDEVLDGRASAYQDPLDRAAGLLAASAVA